MRVSLCVRACVRACVRVHAGACVCVDRVGIDASSQNGRTGRASGSIKKKYSYRSRKAGCERSAIGRQCATRPRRSRGHVAASREQ